MHVDILFECALAAQSLGFTTFLPPISRAAIGNFIGVNYASGAAGILEDTGKASVRVVFKK